MSYILDALKKSESTNPATHGPDLASVLAHSPRPSRIPARRSWARWIGPSLLVVLVIGAGWLWTGFDADKGISLPLGWEINKKPSAQTVTTPRNNPATPALVSSDIQAYAEKIKNTPERPPAATLLQAPLPAARVASDIEEPVLESVGKDTVAAFAPGKWVLEVISYSATPENRFAMVSGEIVRLGDVLTNGYQISEIQRQQVTLEKGNKKQVLTLDY